MSTILVYDDLPKTKKRAHGTFAKCGYYSHRYKIGDAFFHVSLEQAQEMLATSNAKIEEDVSALEDKLSTIQDEMTQLKVELYARFGRSINLET